VRFASRKFVFSHVCVHVKSESFAVGSEGAIDTVRVCVCVCVCACVCVYVYG